MKRITLSLLIVFLLIGFNAFAGDGDLIVNGNVGIGTTNPGSPLAIQSAAQVSSPGASFITLNNTHGTANDQFGIHFTNSGYIGKAAITSELDSGGATARLNFLVGNSPGFAMTINGSGNVGIGTTSPGSQKLHIETTAGGALYANSTDPGYWAGQVYGINYGLYGSGASYGLFGQTAAGYGVYGTATTGLGVYGYSSSNFGVEGVSSSNIGGYFVGSPSSWGVLATSGGIWTYLAEGGSGQYGVYTNGVIYTYGGYAGSDIRLKTNIAPISGALDKILNLRGVTFDWKQDIKGRTFTKNKQVGFIAQDMEKVLPELVSTDPEGYKGITYDKLTAVLVEAIKEQQKKITELEARIKLLEKGR